MTPWLARITAQPWRVVAVAALATLVALGVLVDPISGRLRLGFDADANRLLSDDDPSKRTYDQVRLIFGNDESLLVAYHAEDVFTPPHLRALEALTRELKRVAGVHSVTSLVNAQQVTGTAKTLHVGPLYDELPETPDALRSLRERALASSIYRGRWISEDGRTAALLVRLAGFGDDAPVPQEEVDRAVTKIVQDYRARGDAELWLTGQPHIKAALSAAHRAELTRNIPLLLGLFALLLVLGFRSVRGVVLPLVTVVLALVWTGAVAVWIGRPLNLVTMLVPSVLIILGLSYTIHVIAEYYDEVRADPEADSAELMRRGLAKIALPVGLTGLTTATGFVAMLLHGIQAIREAGLLLLLGIVFGALASLTVLPALLALLPAPRRAATPDSPDPFARFAERVAEVLIERRRAVIVLAVLAGAGLTAAATQLEVTTAGIEAFPPDAPVRADYQAINTALGGANTFNVIVRANYRNAFRDPENLAPVEELQAWLAGQPEIAGAVSVVDYLKQMNRALNADDPAHFRLPETRRGTSTLLFFGASEDLHRLVDRRYQTLNIPLRTPLQRSGELGALADRIEARLAQLPDPLTAELSGNPIVIQRMVEQIIWGQVTSLAGALGVIYLILSALFFSARVGFIALLPNLLPLAGFFGGLALFDVPLSTATSLIAPMALGIAIDDTIHYFTRFRDEAKSLLDEQRATVQALRSVGRPITYTTAGLCIGFLAMTGSELSTQVEFGAMAAFTLAFAWVVDFTLTPALCLGLRVVTLWDTLTLDLGHHPQESIPLFRGLSNLRCRIVAQLASLRVIKAGQPLLRTGERGEGREMYVVLDGVLEVSIDTGQDRRVINQMTRGDLVGEVGFFTRRPSANVDVLEDARLLRLTQKNLEGLRRRHPRIATVLNRNLAARMAELVALTTERERELARKVDELERQGDKQARA